MTPRRLQADKTPQTLENVTKGFRDAWRVAFNEDIPYNVVVILLAHSSLETGNYKEMRAFNFGNVKVGGSWKGHFQYFTAGENLPNSQRAYWEKFLAPRTDGPEGPNMVIRSVSKNTFYAMFYPDHPQCKFRAFETMAAGAGDYIAKLSGRYAVALEAARHGLVKDYVHALRSKGYFTGNFNKYLQAVTNIHQRVTKQFDPNWLEAQDVQVTEPTIDSGLIEHLTHQTLTFSVRDSIRESFDTYEEDLCRIYHVPSEPNNLMWRTNSSTICQGASFQCQRSSISL